jgi:hypothetical protein
VLITLTDHHAVNTAAVAYVEYTPSTGMSEGSCFTAVFRNDELVPLYLRGVEADEAQANWTAACTTHTVRLEHHLRQLAANTPILPPSMRTSILDGDPPPVEEVVQALLVFTLDAAAMTANAAESTWAERRLAWQCVAVALLVVIAGIERFGA